MNKDTLQLVAKHIDDPASFYNFSLVCKSSSRATELLSSQKKVQFAVKVKKRVSQNCPCCGPDTEEGYLLPNGKWHGKYKYYDSDTDIVIYKKFNNGKLQ